MRRFMAGLLTAAIALPAIAQADALTLARLGEVQGRVLVNRGNGFVPVTAGAVLHLGDRVAVMGPGSADVIYSARGQVCHQQLGPDSTATITANPSCTDLSGLRAQVGTGQDQTQQTQQTDNTLTLVGAGAAVVVVGGGIYALTQTGGGNNNPPSSSQFGTPSSP